MKIEEPGFTIQWCVDWLNMRRMAIHERDCIVHQPSARCSCGLHRVMTILRDAANSESAQNSNVEKP